jgi:hypothetical protein
MKGIRVDVLKRKGQAFSNGGLSEFCDDATLILPEGGGVFEPTDDAPAILIIENAMGTIRAVMAGRLDDGSYVAGLNAPEGEIGPMMGGCYVASSDSRFTAECERVLGSRFYGAVPLHDRYESQALYDSNWP